MPDLNKQPVQGGPTLPVYLMNGAPGDPGGGASGLGAPSSAGWTSGTKAASGNNTLIAAPAAGSRIVVYALYIQNESATPTTILLQDQATRMRALLAQYGWFIMRSRWQLNEATALNLNLSAANSHGYSILYAIEKV